MNLSIAAFLTLLINLPFGYWRAFQKKFSFKWFLSIHIPVPLIIFLRYYMNIGFAFYTYPVMVGAFFIGQFAGKKLTVYFRKELD